MIIYPPLLNKVWQEYQPDGTLVAVTLEGGTPTAWWFCNEQLPKPAWTQAGPRDAIAIISRWALHEHKRAKHAEAQLEALDNLPETVWEDIDELIECYTKIREGQLEGLPTQEEYEESLFSKEAVHRARQKETEPTQEAVQTPTTTGGNQ